MKSLELMIYEYLKEHNLERKDKYTVEQLERIAKACKCQVIQVMSYLRYGKAI